MLSRLGLAFGLAFAAFTTIGCSLDAPANGYGQNTASSEGGLDIEAPELSVTRFPPSVVTGNTSTFEFLSTESRVKFECSLNEQGYLPCVSPLNLTSLSDGDYQMSIRAVDAAGHPSIESLHKWRVNRMHLRVDFLTMIPQFTSERNFTLQFQGSAAGSFECRIDLLDYAPCTSPIPLNNLLEGDHAVQIRLRDAMGNQSSPATVTWRVDVSAPILVIGSGPSGPIPPNGFGAANVTFTFQAQDNSSGIRTLTCQFDGGQETNCENTISYNNVSYGVQHTFTVKATDHAGNSSTATRTFIFQNPPAANLGG